MDLQSQYGIDPTVRLPPEVPPRSPRFARIRTRLRSRTGRIILPSLTFLLGILIGVGAILLYALSIAGDGQILITSTSHEAGDIIVQVGPAYITHIVASDLQSSGLPGQVSNVKVTLARGDQITITGDDQFTLLLGVGVTKHFTVVVQPLVNDCQLQMHVLHADLQGIAVTGFVANFEGQVNQQLQVKPTNLPKGFVYCATAVRTDPKEVFVTYSATPT